MVTQPYSAVALSNRDQAVTRFLFGIEHALYFFCILFFTGGLMTVLFPVEAGLGTENPIARLLWFPVYGIVLFLAFRVFPQLFRLATFNALLILCVMLCGISMLWSVDPPLTMRRSVALVVTTLFGLVLAARYDWNALIQRFAAAFLILAVLSFLYSALLPSRGVMQEIHVGAWRGLWVEKNYLGGQMSRGVILMMCAFAMQPKRGLLWVPGGLLCFFLVIMSTSKTALLITLIAIALFIVLRIFRRFPFLRIPLMYAIVAGIGIFVTLMMTIPDEMFAIIGKERTLTGRTDIWDALIVSIKQRPFLGYGYGVYWDDLLGPSYYVRLVLEWGIPSAHNGWIESWLSIGALGVGAFFIHYMITLFLAIDRIKRGGVETYWVVLSILAFLFLSMSESAILQQNDLGWVIYVMTSAKLYAFERPFWRDRPRTAYFKPNYQPV